MKRFVPAIIAALLLPSIAFAQSKPNWSRGYVPTAGEIGNAFSSKQDRLPFTPLSPAGAVMQGKFQTAPATVNGAGLSLLPGVSPSSPSNGDVWTTSFGLFGRVANMTLAIPGLDQSTGALLVPNGPTFGIYQNGKFISRPDAIQIQGAGSTGDVSSTSATTNGVSATLASRFLSLDAKLRAQPPQYQSYDAFGDSITAGYAASVEAKRYVNLLASYLGLTVNNHGVSTSLTADQMPYIYQMSVSDTASQLYTFQIGTNEAYFFGPDPARQATFKATHQAALAWLAMPARSKVVGQNVGQAGITYGSGWFPDNSVLAPGISMKTSTQGATASFPCYGTVCYLAYGLQYQDGGTFTLAVDGAVQGTYTTQGVGPNGLTQTPLGQTHSSALARLDGLANGPHTVTLTVTSATGAGNVWVDWVSGPGSVAGSQFLGGPTVIAGGAPQQGGGTATAALFAQLAHDDADQLASDGLNVLFADVPGHMNPLTDIIADNTHPNDLGMQHIADAYIAALNTASTANAKSGSGASRFKFATWTSFSPSITAQTPGSTPPTITINHAAYQIVGKRVDVDYDFTVATAGTGTGFLFVYLPNLIAAKNGLSIPMSEIALTGATKFGTVSPGSNSFQIRNVDGTPFTLVNGQRFVATASYEIN